MTSSPVPEPRLLAHLFDASPNLIVLADRQARIVKVNEAWRRVLGFDPEELSGRHFFELAHPDDVPASIRCLWSGEHRMRHADGSYRWISWTVPAGSAELEVAIGQDVTETKMHLEELARVREELRSVLETAPAYILKTDREGIIRYINRTYPNHALDQVVGFHVLNFMPPHARDDMQAAIARVLAGEREVEVVVEGIAADGGTAWYRDRLGPIEQDGNVVGVTIVAEDITEWRRAEAERERARRLAAIGRVAGAIAHDFNNLFTAMMGGLDLARAFAGNRDAQRFELEQLRETVERAAKLTAQLFDFGTRRASDSGNVDLNLALRQSEAILRGALGEAIRLEIYEAPEPIIAGIPRSELDQVLLNLVTNSREAMPNGGRVKITVAHEQSSHDDRAGKRPTPYALLSIEDTGPGMPAEVLERIFEPFFSTKSRGSGFGLATCYGIITGHGGDIRVSCPAGGGTVVEVRLPSCAPGSTSHEAHEDAPSAERRPHQETVLIVEDNHHVRATITRYLSQLGFKVLQARDGEDGLSVAQRHPTPIDAVVTDLVMPGLGGIDLLKQLLTPERPNLRALAISGYAEPSDFQWLKEHSVTLLTKPFAPADLARRLEDLLGDAV